MMMEEKFYEMQDGKKYILLENVILDNKRYLLLTTEIDDKVYVAYENNGNLVFLSENNGNFNNILLALYGKLKKSIE